MKLIWIAFLSFLIDLMLGDPAGFPHPVVWMGKGISWFEKRIRPLFPDTWQGQLLSGSLLAVLLPAGTFLCSFGAIRLLGRIHPVFANLLQVFWGWQALAVRDLKKESTRVYRVLKKGSIKEARQAVGRIVGRDTERLDEAGVIRAAVETVAENFSDGVIAPMLYLVLGGAPLALTYKAINTMDSMIGYKNERYLYFGKAAAKMDDAANYIPSRLSAFLLIASAFLCRLDGKNAFRIWRRDRRKHASPNSAQTESAMAGALRVRLAGPAWYFGELYEKPWIGDEYRPVEAEDIVLANRMLYTGSILGLIFLCALRGAVLCGILLL